jgi:hypothetical protein
VELPCELNDISEHLQSNLLDLFFTRNVLKVRADNGWPAVGYPKDDLAPGLVALESHKLRKCLK